MSSATSEIPHHTSILRAVTAHMHASWRWPLAFVVCGFATAAARTDELIFKTQICHTQLSLFRVHAPGVNKSM